MKICYQILVPNISIELSQHIYEKVLFHTASITLHYLNISINKTDLIYLKSIFICGIHSIIIDSTKRVAETGVHLMFNNKKKSLTDMSSFV